ncbi:unnamed protein product [Closterium sp. NIES-64]|nr:unnamed protein product [Closterium sp. NIES-64]
MRYATRSCAAGGCAWRNIRSKGVHVSAEHNLHAGELLRGLFGALRARWKELRVRHLPRAAEPPRVRTRKLTRLSRLCLADCRVMHRLPAQLCAMSVLTALKIHGEGIPESISALKKLRRLNLCNISCAHLDVGEEWRKLEELRLENVSRGWGRFPPISLESLALLTIRHCRSLRALPDDIGAAPALREVEIVDTPIAELPTSIATLTSLERLVLAPSKSMRGLPPTLLALPRVANVMVKNVSALASLIRSGAREEAEGRRQPVARLALVQSFSLECCYFFTHLSPALPALAPSLRALTLADLAALYSLPAEVFRLTALTSLSLLLLQHVNCLPPALFTLSALRALRITSASELAALLESLGQLAALESLELDDCPALRSLPASLGQLRRSERE